ncbi:very short patch repair endonuclease [Geodermatophilus marinus]|uniref:very short patch repair endonuclease n=1 Tax=Geodermatophilus sp. LHW52908 TaxID=2303986 RepID=UPI000E3C4E69|nr:very short patch repair endonuclease [Geodermatophilus sp. LHW52908]RFU21157.1 very short patch repair endonuclease [Geodermatophilus sp. LHW52908]
MPADSPRLDPGPHPGATSAEISRRMSRLRRRDNRPEMAVRRLLYARGLRYRVCFRIPGQRRRTIDIVFVGARLAVYIDGCFWHGCPEHQHMPKANTSWWVQKMAMNRARDAAATAQLEGLGWTVLRFWEHEDPKAVVTTIVARLNDETAIQRLTSEATSEVAAHAETPACARR